MKIVEVTSNAKNLSWDNNEREIGSQSTTMRDGEGYQKRMNFRLTFKGGGSFSIQILLLQILNLYRFFFRTFPKKIYIIFKLIVYEVVVGRH